MTNRLQNKAQKSKLQTIDLEEKQKTLFLNKINNSSVRSFRLDNQTWQDLQNILTELNQRGQRKKISASSLIKALIHLGTKIGEKKIIEAIKETSY